MFNTNVVYTPEQVADLLQLSKNTVYELISKGEIVAKKFGKVYRIPATSLSFLFTGMDEDIYKAQLIDEQNLSGIESTIKDVRKTLWEKRKSL